MKPGRLDCVHNVCATCRGKRPQMITIRKGQGTNETYQVPLYQGTINGECEGCKKFKAVTGFNPRV